MLVYDSVTTNSFLNTFAFGLNFPTLQGILDLSCQPETQVTNFTFSCVALSGASQITDIHFTWNPATMSVVVVNQTTYTIYKDYNVASLKAYKKFIVLSAKSITEAPNAFVIYKRQSYGGTGSLFSAITYEQFGYRDIEEIDFVIYEYNGLYRLFIQPNNSHYSYVFRIGDLQVSVIQSDLASIANGSIILSNQTSFSILNSFYVGVANSVAAGTATSSGATSASSTLLIVLITFVVIIVLAALGSIGYVLYKQSAAKKEKAYVDNTEMRLNNNQSSQNVQRPNRSFENSRMALEL